MVSQADQMDCSPARRVDAAVSEHPVCFALPAFTRQPGPLALLLGVFALLGCRSPFSALASDRSVGPVHLHDEIGRTQTVIERVLAELGYGEPPAVIVATCPGWALRSCRPLGTRGTLWSVLSPWSFRASDAPDQTSLSWLAFRLSPYDADLPVASYTSTDTPVGLSGYVCDASKQQGQRHRQRHVSCETSHPLPPSSKCVRCGHCLCRGALCQVACRGPVIASCPPASSFRGTAKARRPRQVAQNKKGRPTHVDRRGGRDAAALGYLRFQVSKALPSPPISSIFSLHRENPFEALNSAFHCA